MQADLNPKGTSHLVFTGQDTTSTSLLSGTTLNYNGVKADGTGGYYDVELDFANNQLTPGTTATFLITLSGNAALNFNAGTFNNLSTGATTGDFTASAHITGGNNPSIYIGGTGKTLNAVPAPPSLVLALTGMGAVAVLGLRRFRRRAAGA